MGTRSNIAYQKPNGKVVVMYCHYDGYPEYNGKILGKHYNNRAKAHALVDNGYQSSLKPTIIESNEGRVHQDPPETYHSLHSYLMNLKDSWDIEWVYLFKNNNWYVAETKYIELLNAGDKAKFLHERDFMPLWAYFTKNDIAVGDKS